MAEGFASFEFEDKQWQALISKLDKKLKSTNKIEFGGIIQSVVFADIIDHFEKQLGKDGPWAPRKEPYKSWIEGKGKTKILQVSGRLRGSLIPGKGKYRKDSAGILFLSAVPYAAAHDEGLGKMPQRKFMWLSPDGLKKLVDITLKWLAE